MTKFRKKPVVVEAVRFDPAQQTLGELFRMLSGAEWQSNPHGGLDIVTMEGTMTASPGDWIIRGVAGEIYPCKPDIFEQTYEVAE